MKPLLFILSISILIAGSKSFASHLEKHYQVWDAENKCIEKLISVGIERRDIVRINGDCGIK